MPIVHEKAVEIFNSQITKVKGDEVEVIKPVDRYIDKPLIHERLITRDIETEKLVPVYITTEKPVEIEIPVPYIEIEPKLILKDVERIVV